MYDHDQFVCCVLAKSDSSDLQDALREWNITSNFYERDSECFCGHTICDVYSLRNTVNGNVLPYVGSKCVTRFGPRMEKRLAMFKQGKKVVKKGRVAGLTYDEICRDHFDYVKWLSQKGPTNREHKSLIEYARWLFT
jgi:hypothetical protein